MTQKFPICFVGNAREACIVLGASQARVISVTDCHKTQDPFGSNRHYRHLSHANHCPLFLRHYDRMSVVSDIRRVHPQHRRSGAQVPGTSKALSRISELNPRFTSCRRTSRMSNTTRSLPPAIRPLGLVEGIIESNHLGIFICIVNGADGPGLRQSSSPSCVPASTGRKCS